MSFTIESSKTIHEVKEIYKNFKTTEHEELEKTLAEYSEMMKKQNMTQIKVKEKMDNNLKKLKRFQDKMNRCQSLIG